MPTKSGFAPTSVAAAGSRLLALMQVYEGLDVPGYVRSTVYKDGYRPPTSTTWPWCSRTETATAPTPRALDRERYEKLAALLDGAPDWHDGGIVYEG